jgi:hypothetical protein
MLCRSISPLESDLMFNFRVAEESQFEISTAIRIKPGRPAQLSGLSEHLRDDDAFHRAIEMLQMVPPEIDESGLSQQLKDVFERAEASIGEEHSEITVDISTQALWRAILATETESSPNIELNGASIQAIGFRIRTDSALRSGRRPLGHFRKHG